MTPAEVRAQIAAADTAPIYLVESDDLPSRQEVTQAFLALVDEGLQAFNVATFFARDATTAADRDALFGDVLAAARTLPMMAPRRLVVVHDAEALLTPKRTKDEDEVAPAKRRAKAATPAEEFEAYLERPEPTTTLVLETAGLDRGRRVSKLLLARAAVVDCGALRSVEDLARWLRARLDRDEMQMEPAAVKALVEAVGYNAPKGPRDAPTLNLPRLRAEVDKLVLYAAGESTITAAHVRDVVIPVDESAGIFALIDVVRQGQAAAALREVDALLEGGSAAPMILGLVRTAAGQLRPDARARRALAAVLDADLALKTSRGEPRHVLERLVVELCGTVLPRPDAGR
ncbi:MAG: DNA polymerase III subunit delta [Vicinamibacterales bacterium]